MNVIKKYVYQDIPFNKERPNNTRIKFKINKWKTTALTGIDEEMKREKSIAYENLIKNLLLRRTEN